ncbi:MAG: DUF1488 family protein [Burkholderiaceae bacterium]
MKHNVEDGALDFGHEFHGREHHFLLTREALEFFAGEKNLKEIAVINTYNAHLKEIHEVAERLSRTTDPLERIVLERSAFE